MGGAVGLGFGNMYERWPGGINCFYNFLSIGNDANMPEEKARELANKLTGRISQEGLENFLYGERYVKTPGPVAQIDVQLNLPALEGRGLRGG
jgi:hypothetical protein